MRRISSSLTWWYKKVFPAVWFGFLGFWTLAWIPGVVSGRVPALTLVGPPAMAIFGYALMRWLIFPLVDEVWIENNDLIVRNHGQEDRFPAANILNVESQVFANPERVVLTLREPCRFGGEILFVPPFRLIHVSRHPIAEELMHLAHSR